jgi:hypothetical protein
LTIPFQGNHTLVIQPGQPAQGLLDFDLSRSFNVIGNPASPTRIQMAPVIRGSNTKASGTLAGLVLSDNQTPADTADDVPLANATITATLQVQGGQPISITTYTDAPGVYYVPGMDPGDWDVLFQATDHDDMTQSAVTVTVGQQTTLDVTLVKP